MPHCKPRLWPGFFVGQAQGIATNTTGPLTSRYIRQVVVDQLPLSRQFAIAMHERSIDSCDDIEQLRSVAKTLLRAWQLQASFTEDYAAQLMGIKP